MKIVWLPDTFIYIRGCEIPLFVYRVKLNHICNMLEMAYGHIEYVVNHSISLGLTTRYTEFGRNLMGKML